MSHETERGEDSTEQKLEENTCKERIEGSEFKCYTRFLVKTSNKVATMI